MKNNLRNAIATAAIVALMAGTVASAQTTGTDTSGASVTTTSADTSGTPGTPNTGAGGDALASWLLLGASGLVVLGGAAYLASRRSYADSQ